MLSQFTGEYVWVNSVSSTLADRQRTIPDVRFQSLSKVGVLNVLSASSGAQLTCDATIHENICPQGPKQYKKPRYTIITAQP